jgi:hypothetical protein
MERAISLKPDDYCYIDDDGHYVFSGCEFRLEGTGESCLRIIPESSGHSWRHNLVALRCRVESHGYCGEGLVSGPIAILSQLRSDLYGFLGGHEFSFPSAVVVRTYYPQVDWRFVVQGNRAFVRARVGSPQIRSDSSIHPPGDDPAEATVELVSWFELENNSVQGAMREIETLLRMIESATEE